MLWVILFASFAVLIVLDLAVIHRNVREISLYEALAMSAFWISMGLGFAVFVYFSYERQWFASTALDGQHAVFQYLTAYFLEKMLSLDNLFVMALIFHQMQIPVGYQHRVLFWGILVAVCTRALFILFGVYLLNQFDWMIYVFGGFLILSALKMLANKPAEHFAEDNLLLTGLRRFLPLDSNIEDDRFIRRSEHGLRFTPLFVALVLIEAADVMFAVDSVPAVIAVSQDPFIAYSSNVFAILGLRALYFVLASAMQQFHYLKLSMVLILVFIGAKMLLSHIYPVNAMVSLLVIFLIMSVGILASWLDKSHGSILQTSPLAQDFSRIYNMTFAGIKRIIILLVGTSVVLVGIIMIFTPGPAIVVIPAGLAILATEFVWARILLKYFKNKFVYYSQETRNYLRRKKPQPPADDNKDAP